MNVGTPEYDGLLSSVMDHLHEHNDSEETKDLPQLFHAIGADRAQAAALDFKRTKKFAPTQYVSPAHYTRSRADCFPSQPPPGRSKQASFRDGCGPHGRALGFATRYLPEVPFP